MPKYNVLVAVVELIDAPTEAEAISEFKRQLMAAGFEPHDDGPADAFESEQE